MPAVRHAVRTVTENMCCTSNVHVNTHTFRVRPNSHSLSMIVVRTTRFSVTQEIVAENLLRTEYYYTIYRNWKECRLLNFVHKCSLFKST